jgi:FlaA1/EpsC-like NDP-sugar epimerase
MSVIEKLTRLGQRHRTGLVTTGLAGGVAGSLVAAFLLRFDFELTQVELEHLVWGVAIALPVKLTAFYLARVHQGWWSTVGVSDITRIGLGNALASAGFGIATWLVVGQGFPRSIYVIDCALSVIGISGARLAIRMYRQSQRGRTAGEEYKNLLIYGAGWAGSNIAREIHENPGLGYRVIGFLDDDPRKRLDLIRGRLVLGEGKEAAQVVEKQRRKGIRIGEILIAMPTAATPQMREAIEHCRKAGAPCRTLPGIGELLETRDLSRQIRNITVEDLLCRAPVELEDAEVRRSLDGATVLVTGAAGSIGSEICRQVAGYGPRELIALDQAESELFKLELELRSRFPDLKLRPVIADIRQARDVDGVVREHGVEVIFHAAAYKHVPLMEAHAVQAAANNVLGTWNVAQAALRHHVKSFVQLSTDKAVNPSSVMGATKRATELITAALAGSGENGRTEFVSVRFGNVLGSNGSVAPIFQAQIERGGPVTVTHPDMRRYFMTIREAVQLVLQASALGAGSEIFVLDMGQPVRIADLARTMIELAGLTPGQDIEIRYTGTRPGEKLFEELSSKGENILPTRHPKIHIFQEPKVDYQVVGRWVAGMQGLVERRDAEGVLAHLSRLMPEYRVDERRGSADETRVAATA